jgi:hypothetical protein
MQNDLGLRFANALAAKDAVGLKSLLSPDVDFRAMTPGKFWESRDPDDIVDSTVLGTWFSPDRSVTGLIDVESGAIGPVGRVAYRFAVDRPDGAFLIEQQAYYRTDGEVITWLRIMCSGFLKADTTG